MFHGLLKIPGHGIVIGNYEKINIAVRPWSATRVGTKKNHFPDAAAFGLFCQNLSSYFLRHHQFSHPSSVIVKAGLFLRPDVNEHFPEATTFAQEPNLPSSLPNFLQLFHVLPKAG